VGGRAIKPKHLALLLLLAVTAIWGLTFVLVQDAIRIMPVLSFLAWRFVIAGVVMAGLTGRRLLRLPARGVVQGAVMGALVTAGYWLQTFGLARTSVDLAGFLTGLAVVATPVLAFLLWRRRTPPGVWVAALAGLLGLALLSGGGGAMTLGDWLVVGGSIAFAFQLLATDVGVRSYPLIPLVTVELLVTGALSAAGAVATGTLTVPSGRVVWVALLVCALLASVAAFWLQAYAQRLATPAETATVLAAEPLFAALFSYVLQGAGLVAWQWVGASLITGAIVLLGRVAPADEGPPGLLTAPVGTSGTDGPP
jgi:drug/metabolite transporter (DMT)-like permease